MAHVHLPDTARVQIRDFRPGHWFRIDNALMQYHAKAIGPIGVTLYCALSMYSNHATQQCWPSIVRLSQELGLTRLTVRRYIQRLVDTHLIAVTFRSGTSPLMTLLAVPGGSAEQGCLPGEQVSTEDVHLDTGGGHPVTIPCLPGEHEPDINQREKEPEPAPDVAPLPGDEEPPKATPKPPSPPLAPADLFPALATLPPDLLTRLETMARQSLSAEGVPSFAHILPVVQSRMCELWCSVPCLDLHIPVLEREGLAAVG